MQWITQNWLWILLAVGFFFMMRRGGCGMGGGMHGSGGHEGHGGHESNAGHESHSDHDGQKPHHAENISSDTWIDPVNKATLDRATALTSVYHGKTYYFGSAENRTVFEADPAQYASAEQAEQQPHKSYHHGC